ncbi:hypothetical protein ACB092_11G050700 [Castanea dentata]
MVYKDYSFFSYVFLATTVILLAGHVHGAGLCDNSPNKQVCYSIVYKRTDPREATVAAVHKLVDQTRVAKVVAQRQTNSTEITKCITNFNGAIINTKDVLLELDEGDYSDAYSLFNAASNKYLGCDEKFSYANKTNPIAKSTKHLKAMAEVGAYLTTLIK